MMQEVSAALEGMVVNRVEAGSQIPAASATTPAAIGRDLQGLPPHLGQQTRPCIVTGAEGQDRPG